MAGLSGKTGWIAGKKQTAKGTPGATPAYRNAFSGGNIAPVRETDRLVETDTQRDQGAAYVTTSGVEGSPELYARSASLGFYLAAVLGGVTAPVAGVHTLTPAQALAYHTFWRNVGGASGVYERFEDCFVGSLGLAAEAGSPLTLTAGINGLKTVPRVSGDSDFTSLVALENSVVPTFNNATVKLGLGGAAISTVRNIRSFDLTIENNISRQQTDDVVPYDVVVGTREISLGFDMIFEDVGEYNFFHYGANPGVAETPNIYVTAAEFSFAIGASDNVKFSLPSIAYEELPVEPSPGGDPIVVPCRAVAQKAVGISDLLTVALTNAVTTYVT